MRDLKIVIVGHVDHGKSTMIGRLLYDTDSLAVGKYEYLKKYHESMGKEMEFAYLLDALTEEQEQNITIDTTQIIFKSKKRPYIIIDAPGHREFTKNMITGASQAEAAVLIVSAKDGLQEQTRRHAYILSMLGLQQVVVVVNKLDLTGYDEVRFNAVKNEVEEFLSGLGITPKFVVPIAAKTGENLITPSPNMPWHTGGSLIDALDTMKNTQDLSNHSLCMPVQDVYKVDDKRIVVGRVEAGTISQGEMITVLPGGETTSVSSVEEFLKPGKMKAKAGDCTGIMTKDALFIERGNIICSNRKPSVTMGAKVSLFWMSKDPLRKEEMVIFKCATQSVSAQVEQISKRIDSSTLEILQEDAEHIKNREVGEITFTFSKEIVVDNFNQTPELGRFVIERAGDVVGGGIIRV